MTAITGPVAWICSPNTGEITGYRRKVNGVYTDFPFPLPNAAMSLADAVVVPQPLWITNSTTGVIEGYRRAIGNLDVDYNAYLGVGTPAGRVTLGVQWLANIATGEIIGYRTTNADGSITDRSVAFGATLLLDFTNTSTLDPRITFTRSTTATFTGSNGLIQTAAIDTPRFDYDPVTLAPLGLLIEEQRTNLLLQSADLFENGTGSLNWQWTTGVVTSNTQVAPDGTITADTITTTGAAQSIYQSATVAASTTYTFSAYVRLGTMLVNDYKIAVFNNNTLSFIALDVVPTQTPTTNGWTRIQYSFTTPVGCTSIRVYPFRNSNALDSCTVFFGGAQLEAGAFATSYIPTVASQVTRAADVAVMTGTNFSSWYNATEGTIFTESSVPYTMPGSNFPLVASLNDGTANNRIENGYLTATLAGLEVAVGGVGQVGQYPFVGGAVLRRNAGAYKLNDFAISANAGAVLTDTVGTVPVVDRLRLGERTATSGTNANFLNGHIRKIAYYPRRLSNAALQGITS
jgi:hypothetical protein